MGADPGSWVNVTDLSINMQADCTKTIVFVLLYKLLLAAEPDQWSEQAAKASRLLSDAEIDLLGTVRFDWAIFINIPNDPKL